MSLFDETRAAYFESLTERVANHPSRHKRDAGHWRSLFGEVYVFRGVRYVKIGYSRDPEDRRRQLSVPFPIELVLTLPGTPETETAIQCVLDRYRSRGDWFHHNSYVSDGIQGLRCITESELAASIKAGWFRRREWRREMLTAPHPLS